MARYAIADPPYLRRGARLYGPGANAKTHFHNGTGSYFRQGRKPSTVYTTEHPNAADWDNPARHTQLVHDLERDYDGWAIAMSRDSLPTYLAAAPDTRIAVWVKPNAVPGGSHILTSWEPVMLRVPPTRCKQIGRGQIRDVLTAAAPQTDHVGAKPPAWTRWVLDMLAYRQNEDTVHDIFGGSGAVTNELAQLIIET